MTWWGVGIAGMLRSAAFRWLMIVAILGGSLLPLAADAATGRVVATDSVNIRSCPTLDCPVIGAAALGDDIEITGAAVNGFHPVRWFGVNGWAFGLYVQDGSTAPWLVEGDVWCGRVAFVFNIGIGYTPSQSILNTLVSEGVDATMFPMGSFARSQPGYLRQLDDAGFPIGTHGDQNLFLTQHGDDAIRQDMLASVGAIEQVIGRSMDPFMTPYAADTDNRVRSTVSELGLLPVGWTIAANDYASTATESAVYSRVMNNMHPGAIVEFHLDGPATEQSTARALPRIIRDLRAQGYEMVTVPEMADPCGLTWPVEPLPEATVLPWVGNLRCRTTPSTLGGIITSAPSNSTLPVRGNEFNNWVPVTCSGQHGWMHGDYLSVSTPSTPEPTPTAPPVTPVPTSTPPTEPPATTMATVSNTGGANLRCRSIPSTSGTILANMAAGSQVDVRGESINGWTPIRCSGQDGWAASQYLTLSGGTDPTPTPPASTATVVNTGGDNLRCRSGPAISYAIVTLLPAGTVVTVRGANSGEWVPVVCGGRNGWAHGDYMRLN